MFDSNYIAELSDDAAPALLESLPAMNFEQQCIVKIDLARRLKKAEKENDFRTWNLSRWKARREMSENMDLFNTADCSAYTRSYHSDFHD